MNDPVKVRALLESFGYEVDKLCDDDSYYCCLPDSGGYTHVEGVPLGEAADAALAHLLNNYGLTGAKQEELRHLCGSTLNISDAIGGEFVCRPWGGEWSRKWLRAPTVDEAVNRLLLCVHDLVDPRGAREDP